MYFYISFYFYVIGKYILTYLLTYLHPVIENLKARKVIFLPPNTTSKLQPMDQVVIRSLKAPKIPILYGMQMLVSAWNSVPEETIVNCFRKAGISAESQTAAIADDDDPFKELQEGIDTLRTCQPDLIPEDIDANTLVEVDSEIIATQPLPSDNEILAEFMDIDDQDDDIEFIDDK